MSITEKSFVLNNLCHLTSYPFVKTTNGKKLGITFAKKKDLSENSTQQENIFPLKVSNPILSRSVVAVLGLGFIDAGYAFRVSVPFVEFHVSFLSETIIIFLNV